MLLCQVLIYIYTDQRQFLLAETEMSLLVVSSSPGCMKCALLVKVKSGPAMCEAVVVDDVHVPFAVGKDEHVVPRKAPHVVQVRGFHRRPVAEAALLAQGLFTHGQPHQPAVCTHCGPSRQKTPRSPPVRPHLPVLLVQQGPQGEPVREARLVQHVQVGVEGFELGDGVHARHGAKVDEHHGRATPPSALPSHTHAVCIGSGLRHRVVFGVKHGLTKEKKKKGQTRGMSKKVCRKRYNKRSHLNACRNIDLP
mmetsp:Transcript_37863/g.74864  ORF Transcript_37863/g.74864 Transcript_37863/m.74864 type:complete len:252 (+) Transcript_37863:72-827(+)